ncbi:winged helix-turn-helix transcriptional regulator [Candidatus Bathyarchaeota archaeon]|nr:winged helix-turn-helix transcriptional regulator [Candidatus Bathyarchaeota archaeon]
MFKDEILENERRRKIFKVIETNPGIHLRELQRALNIPLATLEYHLGYMTRKKIIYSEAAGHRKRYYAKPLDPEDRKILSVLRQKRMREIVLTILANKKVRYQSLSEHLKLPRSTLSFYLKYLVDNKILLKEKIGYENLYAVQGEDRVVKVLTAYKSSFLDTLVDKALNAWMETQFRKETNKF